MTPDPLNFLSGIFQNYFILANRSGLKFGQVYGMLSPRLRQILAEPLNLTPDPTRELECSFSFDNAFDTLIGSRKVI